jgi:hypothetical protein
MQTDFWREDHFSYRITSTQSKSKGHSQQRFKVCTADGSKYKTGQTEAKYTAVYCKKCDMGLCLGVSFDKYHSKKNCWK